MSNTNILELSIFASSSIIEDYFKTHNLSNNIQINPIAITAKKISLPSWLSTITERTDLIDLVSNRIGKEVQIKNFNPTEIKDIDGICVEYNDSATIYINDKLNFCNKRFIVAKELCHLLINKGDSRARIDTTNLEDLGSILAFLLLDGNADNKQKESEIYAYFGAMELLLPKQYIDLLDNKSSVEIAESSKTPLQVVELRMVLNEDFNDVYENPQFTNARMSDIVSRAKPQK